MGDVVDINSKRKPSPETLRLYKVGGDIDAIIMKELQAGKIPILDIAAVIAHRLGNLISLVDKKDQLLEVCTKIMVRQSINKNPPPNK